MKAIVFDIDGTLIRGSKCHAEAFSYGIRKIYGINASINEINPDGMTDMLIVEELLKKHGISDFSRVGEVCEEMENYFESCEEEIEPLDGVVESLEYLGNRFMLGLATGNLEGIGWKTVERAGIREFFSVGGFGSDCHERACLLSKARERAKEGGAEVVAHVGDTPADIKAAKQNNIVPIAVATGRFGENELSEAALVLPKLGREAAERIEESL